MLLYDGLVYRGEHLPDERVYTWLDDKGEEAEVLTAGELLFRARGVATMLQQKLKGETKGQCVMLVFEPGLAFTVAFWGCVLVGCIAVPVYPPHPSQIKKGMIKFGLVVQQTGAKVRVWQPESLLVRACRCIIPTLPSMNRSPPTPTVQLVLSNSAFMSATGYQRQLALKAKMTAGAPGW